MTRKQKEKLVIRLAEEGKTTRQIAQIARISLKSIGQILRKYRGEDDEPDYQNKNLSLNSKAFSMLKQGKSPLAVSIVLDMDADTTLNVYRNYTRLVGLGEITNIYDKLGPDWRTFVYLYKSLIVQGLATRQFIEEFLSLYSNIEDLKEECKELNEFLIKLNNKKIELERAIQEKTKGLKMISFV